MHFRQSRALPIVALLTLAVFVTASARGQPVPSGTSEVDAKGADLSDLTTARDVRGMSLWDPGNHLLGEVDDVILDRGTTRLRLVVTSFGGVLGIGAKDIAIEWSEIDYNPHARLLRTHRLTADDLKERPAYRSDPSGISVLNVR